MIVKKIKNKPQNPKPKSWQIKDLVDYIRFPHNVNPEEKIEYAGSRNFLSQSHAGQRTEMIALANETVHSKMPVQHWVFSWKEGEQPTDNQIEEFVDIFLEQMGLIGHQVVFGLHNNTDNYHLHIAINRVDPDTTKVIQPHKGFDIEAAHRVVAIVENKQGWESEKKSRYVVLENGEVARRNRKPEIKPRQSALDFEHAQGEKSAQRIVQERGYEIIDNASTWKELHERLEKVGLRFERKGSGAIIFVGDIAVKASSVDRKFSMKKLIKRLGDFVPGSYQPAKIEIFPEPVSDINYDDWLDYQKEKMNNNLIRIDNQNTVQNLKEKHKIQRRNITFGLARHGLSILNIGRHFLKKQQDKETKSIQFSKRTMYRKRGLPRFEEWLRRREKTKEADKCRYRHSFENVKPIFPEEEGEMVNTASETANFNEYDKAINADSYRVTCIKMDDNGNKKTFILDKKDEVTNGFSPEEIRKRMPEIIRLQSRGENIYYTPLSETYHFILIDDMTKEKVDEYISDGFQPSILLESSAGNFQCILTVPKLGTEFDRDVGNRLTELLNRRYGDPKLSGCVHPHRAPGFQNRKPKHRQADGSFPRVSIVWSRGRECATALELSRQINTDYTVAMQARKQKLATERSAPSSFLPSNPISAYQAHLANIQKHLTIEDASRVDAMIALRMRSNGHSQEDVTQAICQCAPAMRGVGDERRDWQRYAERTAAYAFGIAGDRDLTRYEKYVDHWRRIEGLLPQDEKNRQQRQKMR